MGRIVAIDWGKKRCGLAVSDPLRLIATSLTTVSNSELRLFLRQYISNECVDLVVIGYPKQMNNCDSETMPSIIKLAAELQKEFVNMKIELYDERFTSKLAQRSILETGVNRTRRQDKALVDRVSATIILQDFMESLRMKGLL